MGLPSIATRAIWLLAIVVTTGTAIDAYFEVVPEFEKAQAASAERAFERTWTRLSTTWCYVGTRVSLTAANLGPEPLDALNATVLVDGRAYTDFAKRVDGRADSSVWAPGQNATFRKTAFMAEPSDVALVTSTGVLSYPSRVTCIIALHISAMGLYKNGAPAATFTRGTDDAEVRVTVVEDDGTPFEGATVDIEWVRPNTAVERSVSVMTGVTGVATDTWDIPNGAQQGTWTVRVTNIRGPDITYDSAANVVSQLTFSVVK